MVPTRDDAWTLLNEHTHSASLIKHALAVEAAMRQYARRFEEDQELWGVTGLIHDFDYEEHPTPEEHPLLGAQMLEDLGWPDAVVMAVKGHGTHLGVPRTSKMAKTLFAVDELTGLVMAAALVRPGRDISTLKVKSVKKKMKDKGFARAVSRDDIALGAQELGVDMGEHIAVVIEAMQGIAEQLELGHGE